MILKIEIKIKLISFFLKDSKRKENTAAVVSVVCKQRWQMFSCVFAQGLSVEWDFASDNCHWEASVKGRLIGARNAFQQQEAVSHALCELVLTLPPALQTLKPSHDNIWPQSSDLKGKSHLPTAGLAWILSMTRMDPCLMLVLYQTTSQCFMSWCVRWF